MQLPALSDSRRVTLPYSRKRCLSSQTRSAASKSALVRVSVPAAAIVVAGSVFVSAPLPLRPRPRPRLCALFFLTRRVDSLTVRFPLLFIDSLSSLMFPEQLPCH